MALWENWLIGKAVGAAAGSAFAPYVMPALTAGSALLSGGKLLWDFWEAREASKEQKSELQKQIDEKKRAEKMETELLAKKRAMNYARASAHWSNAQLELGRFDMGFVNAGIDLYSGFAQQRRLQFLRAKEQEQMLIVMGQA